MVKRALTWLLLASLLQGCHLIFPFGTVSSDASPSPADAAADGSAGEVGPSDAAPESGAAADAARGDVLAPDGPGDGGLPPDLGPADGKADTVPLTAPCNAAGGVNAQLVYSTKMVLCRHPTVKQDQCLAEAAFCNTKGGWRMCNATEFLGRGGKATPASITAWIKSCVRNGNTPVPPSNSVCKCDSQTAPKTTPVMWACTGPSSTGSASLYIGAATRNLCRRIGTNIKANDGMWRTYSSAVKAYAAVCCY